MFAAKISSVLAGGILVLGGSAIALAQAGGPPEERPEEATQHAQSVPELPAVSQDETTETVGDDGGATAFSEWVESLSDETSENHLEGCERGLTIAANAQAGPTDFDPADPAEIEEGHAAIEAGCADDTQNGLSADDLPEDGEGGEEFGRQTAEENSGGAAEFEDEDDDAGPPSDPGPPSEAGASGDAGPPSDAGSRGGR